MLILIWIERMRKMAVDKVQAKYNTHLCSYQFIISYCLFDFWWKFSYSILYQCTDAAANTTRYYCFCWSSQNVMKLKYLFQLIFSVSHVQCGDVYYLSHSAIHLFTQNGTHVEYTSSESLPREKLQSKILHEHTI